MLNKCKILINFQKCNHHFPKSICNQSGIDLNTSDMFSILLVGNTCFVNIFFTSVLVNIVQLIVSRKLEFVGDVPINEIFLIVSHSF